MEITSSLSGPLIFPVLHRLIYISKICHWSSTIYWDLIGPMWRIDDALPTTELDVTLIDLSISMHYNSFFDPLWYMYYSRHLIFIQLKAREKKRIGFQAFGFHSQALFKLSFPLLWQPVEPNGKLKGNAWLFVPPYSKPAPLVRSLGSLEASCLHPDWGKYAGRCVVGCSRGKCRASASIAAMDENKCGMRV